jgi:succinyl-CoA synthetase alpha subunit
MILVNRDTRVLVQGITGREATFHTQRCIDYGTNVVGGVTPGKGGTTWGDRLPVFDTVEQALRRTAADTSLIFVPAQHASDAIMEAADAGIPTVVCITEHIPTMDEVRWHQHIRGKGVRVIGPNCPGLIAPAARCKVGILPGNIATPGNVGVVSRSGTLTYEVVNQLTMNGMGQSTCVGLGGDPLPGTTFVDILQLFQEDADTDAVVLIGEIGGTSEQEAAEFIRCHVTKPVVAFIAGASAPPGRRMGHAGAIITGRASRASEKKQALAEAGAIVVDNLGDLASAARSVVPRSDSRP